MYLWLRVRFIFCLLSIVFPLKCVYLFLFEDVFLNLEREFAKYIILSGQFFSSSRIKTLLYHLLGFLNASERLYRIWHCIIGIFPLQFFFFLFRYFLFFFGVSKFTKYLSWTGVFVGIYFYLLFWDLECFLNSRIHVSLQLWEFLASISSNITSPHSCIFYPSGLWLDMCYPFSF